MTDDKSHLIDRWFPVAAVDESVRTSEGSGRSEKALMTWFASRPIAQARAAALCVLLPNDDSCKPLVEEAVRSGDADAMSKLAGVIEDTYGGRAPVVLDIFSGRAILPLEAARAGAVAVGLDLSPVATLAGRLLADYPMRDWSGEPPLPFGDGAPDTLALGTDRERLASDVETILATIGARVAEQVAELYPRNDRGEFPWGYLWALVLRCDGCKRTFPMIGSMLIKHPCIKRNDPGQSLVLETRGDSWKVHVVDGPVSQDPTYRSPLRADGRRRKGKSAICPFCSHVHPLETVKSKGANEGFADELLAVLDTDANGWKFGREPTADERRAASTSCLNVEVDWPYPAVPDERIPDGNVHTVMASGYGYRTYGQLANERQTRTFIETVKAIRDVHAELLEAGVSAEYATALSSYAAANLCRRLRLSTRGAWLRQHGNSGGTANNRTQVADLFANESSVNFQVDYFEAGPGDGAGTWASVSTTALSALRGILNGLSARPARIRRGTATALPLRDGTVDVVLTDPPYDDMIEYADVSDLFYVWLKRALFDIEPDLFAPAAQLHHGLQDKDREIIVRRVHEPGRVRHDDDFYEAMLALSFAEARRVLVNDGHLVVVFGHSDPDAWLSLLSALRTAGFVVTAAWPSRTESTNSGVASIKVTVTIGCRVAPTRRPDGTAAEVEREVVNTVRDRSAAWDADGLALEDQLMASYGPAMEVFGRYRSVLNPDGTDAPLERFLTAGRRAVRDTLSLQVDRLPLETFDAVTRFAVFWLRAKGRGVVPKGEAVFFAQADQLQLHELRERVLAESRAGFSLRLDDPGPINEESSTFEVVRAAAAAAEQGGTEAAASVLIASGRAASDEHFWAVVSDLSTRLPASDDTAKALAGLTRTRATVARLVGKSEDEVRSKKPEQIAMFTEGDT